MSAFSSPSRRRPKPLFWQPARPRGGRPTCPRPGGARAGALAAAAGLVLLMAATGACERTSGGLGIGLPNVPDRALPIALPVALTRIYLPDDAALAATRYVELVNNGNQALDLGQESNRLILLSNLGSAPLPATTWQPGSTLQLVGAALDGLHLHRYVGELALIDAQANVQAYAAWGLDGLSQPGDLGELAQQSGFAVAAVAAVPPTAYPLANDLALLLGPQATNANAACTAAAATTMPFAATACTARAGALAPRLSRVVPADVTQEGASLELYNPDPNGSLDPYGLTLCTTSAGCTPLFPRSSPGLDGNLAGALAAAPAAGLGQDPIQALQRRRLLFLGSQPVPQAADGEWVVSLPPPRSTDELALLPPGADGNAQTLTPLCYLRLAAAANTALTPPPSGSLLARLGNETLQQAWQAQAAVAPKLDAEAATALVDAAAPLLPTAWRLDAAAPADWPTRPLLTVAAPYTACSAPESPAEARLLLSSLTLLANGEVRLQLTAPPATAAAAAPAPLAADATLYLGDTAFAAAALAALPAGDSRALVLSPTPSCATSADVCLPVPNANLAALLAAGSLSVADGAGPALHVQWQPDDGAQPASLQAAAAVAAGLWPGLACRVAFAAADAPASLRLLDGHAGLAPADYVTSTSLLP